VDKQVLIIPQLREVADLEVLAEALLDLAATVDDHELARLLSPTKQRAKRVSAAPKRPKGTAA